jgi:hypothetical protein
MSPVIELRVQTIATWQHAVSQVDGATGVAHEIAESVTAGGKAGAEVVRFYNISAHRVRVVARHRIVQC